MRSAKNKAQIEPVEVEPPGTEGAGRDVLQLHAQRVPAHRPELSAE